MKKLLVCVLFMSMMFHFAGCITDSEALQGDDDVVSDDFEIPEEKDEETADADKDQPEEPDETEDPDEDETPPLTATIILSKETVYEHKHVEFSAEVTGGTPPYMYKWSLKNEGPFSTNEKTGDIKFEESEEKTVFLEVMDFDERTFETEIKFTVHPLEGNMNFYFGNLHSHSAMSDGEGTPPEVMEWAKNHDDLDFYAMTDHAEQLISQTWNWKKTATDQANQDGVFVALRGFEWSHPVFGHINVFETEKYTAAYNILLIKDFYDWIEKNDGIGQFNHPGREPDHFNRLKLEPHVLSHMFAIETGNKGTGNNNGEFIPYYIKALDNGWHVAPVSNQDNHKLEMNSHRTVYVGEELTREHLLEAMKSRRLYSSDDPDIKIVFKLDEHWMGSHVHIDDSNVRFSVKVMDNEPVLKMELITNGGIVAAQMEPTEDDDPMNLFWFPEVFVMQDSYFFLRVTSEDIYDDERYDIQIALTAPIWIYR